MRKESIMVARMWMAGLLVAAIATVAAAEKFTITTQSMANDQTVEARILLGDPNVGMVGPWGAWNDADTDHTWGVGLCGQINLSRPIVQLLSDWLKIPETWWGLLDQLDAQAYGGLKLGLYGLGTNEPTPGASPVIGTRIGPLFVEASYDIFEGGRVRSDGETLARNGPVYVIGLQRVFQF
jgi:hypothetical protein